ncbi:BON domain-containing protein [Leptolyngbya sp. FACHB-261]|uniref:BON domain-containing protein n=1 Tax=Leptolyngbya sp. FACHB-261 TaxID=2692806 RepID=UPI0016824E07|nr:BON domain-containing protein [Leptolyngbya sp. FACHB-261]MBD2102935.1 BON domain-containing protein [Leptolyngbya sp. FACHB-261]
MKKLTPFLLSGFLLLGLAACDTAQTSANAPDTTATQGEVPEPEAAQANQNDASSEVRKNQLEADIRAREQRNDVAGDPNVRADGDLESEIRSKLEANLPASKLTVDAEEGVVTISGSVPTQAQLDRVASLAQEIQGVKSVDVKATVAKATPQ